MEPHGARRRVCHLVQQLVHRPPPFRHPGAACKSGGNRRLAESDPAVGRERQPFAVQQDFVLALDGDVSAVGAVIEQEKLVVARFQGAVLPRRQLVGDHQVAGLAPADHDFRVVFA